MKMKKKIFLLPMLALLLLFSACGGSIGSIRGAERQTITVDGTEYRRMDDTAGLSYKDRGRYLGKVTDGGDTMFRIFTVKGDSERQVLYCRWDWEGDFYERCPENG